MSIFRIERRKLLRNIHESESTCTWKQSSYEMEDCFIWQHRIWRGFRRGEAAVRLRNFVKRFFLLLCHFSVLCRAATNYMVIDFFPTFFLFALFFLLLAPAIPKVCSARCVRWTYADSRLLNKKTTMFDVNCCCCVCDWWQKANLSRSINTELWSRSPLNQREEEKKMLKFVLWRGEKLILIHSLITYDAHIF